MLFVLTIWDDHILSKWSPIVEVVQVWNTENHLRQMRVRT